MATSKRSAEIRQFILDHVRQEPSAIVVLVAIQFQISRSAARKHLGKLVSEGVLHIEGLGQSRKYCLSPLMRRSVREDIREGLQEDVIYLRTFSELLNDLPTNVSDICHYGFTEIVNNAIQHSKGTTVFAQLTVTAADVQFVIVDDGVGVFNSLEPALHVEDTRHAVLELVKGKLTTDPKRHSGEGLYFTSRCFDHFTISCSGITLIGGSERDWHVDQIQLAPKDGTYVQMLISRTSPRAFKSVIDTCIASDADYGFSKTEIPVNSAIIGTQALTSRSQATRLLSRLDCFREVVLDFAGVSVVGQGFADEIFRVFALDHPEIKLKHKNANTAVLRMIKHAQVGMSSITHAVVDADIAVETVAKAG